MSNDRFYITLSNEDEVYAPGSDIEGVAHIILEEATKAQFLKISLDARARTEWKQSIGSGKSMSTKFYSAKVIYADEEVVAWSSPPGTTEVLPVGSHHYPFTLKLPPDLPPSFEGKYGYVRYMVKMELDRPWYRSNKKTTKAFTDELFIRQIPILTTQFSFTREQLSFRLTELLFVTSCAFSNGIHLVSYFFLEKKRVTNDCILCFWYNVGDS
ncbi:hypothetical protein Y032_0203g1845 [Ancylostoma ceylanicum]|nr:hypothetical protein Y032_0203g1845 [Ancylostoma ceylanicum]